MKRISYYLGLPGIVLVVFGIFAVVLIRDTKYQWLALTQLSLGGVCLIFYFVFFLRDFLRTVAHRVTDIGGVLGGIVFLALLILINVVANTKLEFRKDLTVNRVFSLAPDSRNLIKGLEEEIEIYGFVNDGSREKKMLEGLVGMYLYESNKIKIHYVDPDKQPALAKQFSAKLKDIVVRNPAKKKEVKIGAVTEEELSSAIKKVSRGKTRTLCFTKGHGEADFEDGQTAGGFAIAKTLIENEGFAAKAIQLTQTPEVPADCNLVAVVGPEKSFLKAEVDSLANYYRKGGHLVLLLEPTLTHTKDAIQLTGFENFLRERRIQLTNTVILEYVRDIFGRQFINPQIGTDSYGDHEITRNMGKDIVTAFTLVRAIEVGPGTGTAPTVLAKSSKEAWAERDVASVFLGKKPSPSAREKRGPLNMGLILEEPNKDKQKPGAKSKLVVFGDSDFATNKGLRQGYNADLLLNTFAYLVGAEKGLAIRARTLRTSSIQISPDQRNLVLFLSVFLLPELIIIFGLWVWMFRRQRG